MDTRARRAAVQGEILTDGVANPVAVVTGVGPGTGAAIVRRFARGGYAVAMLARTRDRLGALAREIEGARAYPCDVTDEVALDRTLAAIRGDLGAPTVLVHNAVGGAFGNFLDIDPEVLNRNFQVNAMALLHLARRLAPAMIDAGAGAIIATGNTSAFRGKASFAGFAPTKAAQRILAESIARAVGPKGVHVAYVTIDAVIDLEWTRRMFPDAPDEFFIKPAAIADEVWHVAHQDRSAWSFNVELRPFRETW
jgi:short-subunit dehydrogenase